MKSSKLSARGIFSIVLALCMFALFSGSMYKLQIIDGEEYAQASKAISVKRVNVAAARGEIVDRNGVPLVTNRQGNSIVFDCSYFPKLKQQEQRNTIINALINLFEIENVKWEDNLPIVLNEKLEPVFVEGRESDISALKGKDILNLNEYASARNCMDALIEKFQLESFKPETARKIASVCYDLRRLNFSVSNPYTFAYDVPTELVAKIKENSAFFTGVSCEIVPYREYADGTLMPHTLGMVGAISAEEYEKSKNGEIKYALNDIIGKNGIERGMEKYLRGTAGVKTVSTDAQGNVATDFELDPIQGNTVVLTVDSKLQAVVKTALAEGLRKLEEKSIINTAGAAVVIDVNSGEILASDSYPSYDISAYRENYEALSKDARAPLWNRVLMSTYSPGSTMKPCTALAGLEEGVITRDTIIRCTRVYKYKDVYFRCNQPHATLNKNVVSAINESCNIFFYETGKNLGISKIAEYASILGLGQKTGVELNEVAGTLDSEEYRASLGQTWYPGFTLQNAIGQGGSMFTPIQLANYCATIANGGTRYRPHYVRSIKSYDYSRTVLENKPEVVLDTGFSAENIATVKEGMKLVGTVGYCKSAFSGLPIDAAAKTGTSQVDRKINGDTVRTNNGFLITYAPADDPQIAIAIAGEGVSSGSALAPIAADIYKYYFTYMGTLDSVQNENELLK